MSWPTGPMWAPPARRSEHSGWHARVEDDRLVVYSVTRGDTYEADEVSSLPLEPGDQLDTVLDDMGWERTGPWSPWYDDGERPREAPVKPYGP